MCWHGFGHPAGGGAPCSALPEDADFAFELGVTYAVTWQFAEAESPMVGYEFGVGSYYGGWDVLELQETKANSIGIRDWGSIAEEGQYYFAVVRGRNAAGRYSYCVGNTIKWDSTKPVRRGAPACRGR